MCKCWLDLQASEAELILCNSDEKMMRGMAAPTPHVIAPRQQRPRCGGARQRRLLCVATATPQSRCSGAQRRRPLCVTLQTLPRRLKVFSQATTRTPLWRHGVGSRLSLNMKPGADRCGLGKSTVVSSLARTKALLVLLQTGFRHQARGPDTSTKVFRRTTALLRALCSSK